jgi:hypothetical protein
MKFPKLFSKQKPTQEIQAFGIEFLSEQDGPNEKLLKEKLSTIFRAKESIESAYLVRAHYKTPNQTGVALCVRTSSGPDKKLVESVHDLFRREAPRGTLLDIMFPSDRQLVEIEKVCKPFYRRDSDV